MLLSTKITLFLGADMRIIMQSSLIFIFYFACLFDSGCQVTNRSVFAQFDFDSNLRYIQAINFIILALYHCYLTWTVFNQIVVNSLSHFFLFFRFK